MNAKLNWRNFITALIVSSVIPVVAADRTEQSAHKHKSGEFGILTPIYAVDKESTNAWHPTFTSIPIKEQFRMVQDDVHWGVETNYIKAGLLLLFSPNTNRTDVAFFPVLHTKIGRAHV